MIGFIYETTNLITNKKYIGKRQTNWRKHEIDSYLGSSKLLIEDIKKYGKNNFSREIICTAESKKELVELEIYHLKTRDAVTRDDYYNLTIPRLSWADGWIQKREDPAVTKKRADAMRGVKRGKYNMTIKFRGMSEEKEAQIIQLHEQGMTPWMIQQRIKYNCESVKNFLKSKGLTPIKKRGKQLLWTKKQEKELLKLYEKGYSATQIGEYIGRTTDRVTSKLKELNVEIRDPNWYKHNGNYDIIIE